jgi:hypothetical protein
MSKNSANSRSKRKKIQRHNWCGELGIPHTMDRGVINKAFREQRGH